MIQVNRTAKPEVLQRQSQTWLANLQAAIHDFNNISKNPKATATAKKQAKVKVSNAQRKYNHSKIKQALVEMFHGKCAYCESQITVVTYGNIEHFYPKAQYIDKTFAWENMLLACDICNNSRHKGTKFPLSPNGEAILIGPTDGVIEPSAYLKFVWDAQAGLTSIYGRDARGREVEQIFDFNGLQGRKALVKARSEYVKTLMVLLKSAQEDGNEEALALLKEACQPDAPYLAFALTFIAPHITSQNKSGFSYGAS